MRSGMLPFDPPVPRGLIPLYWRPLSPPAHRQFCACRLWPICGICSRFRPQPCPPDVARVPFEGPMPRSRRARLFASVSTVVVVAALLLHGCSPEPTAPPATRGSPSYRLNIGAGSSSASGGIVASRGGIDCTVVGATSASEVLGACTSVYPAGTIVSLTATAASGAVLKLDEEWGATCQPNVEEHRVCQVTMDRDHEVAATFVPASTSFTLTVSGGAAGSGTVYSNPSGISCTITDGKATSGNCSAGFARGTQVKLTARIARGQRLKAWAGGGCDVPTVGKATLAQSCT